MTHANLPARLQECATRMGGKRALAKAAGLSEAQLFRYLNGDSEMGVGKLAAIAGAANVSASWLLTGEGEPIVAVPEAPAKAQEPSFNPKLMETLSRQLDELLIEYQQRLTPQQKSRGLTFLYQALRQDEVAHGSHTPVDRELILHHLDFFNDFKDDELTETYKLFWEQAPLDDFAASQLYELLKSCVTNLYQGNTGKNYFKRVGKSVSDVSIKRINRLIQRTYDTFHHTQVNILDVGTGNGRELAYIHQHYPTCRVHGIEPSDLGIQESKYFIKQGLLSPHAISQGYADALPYENESMHLVSCRMLLHCIPYFKDSTFGVSIFFQEVKRVLKIGGIINIITRQGCGRKFAPFSQLYQLQDFEALASLHGFKVVEHHQHKPFQNETSPQAQIHLKAMFQKDFIEATLQKL